VCWCSGVRVRLAGGTSSEGRLEVYYRGIWGTVCDDHFNYIDAAVACNSLGFGLVLTSSKRHKTSVIAQDSLWRQESLVDGGAFSLKFAIKVTHPPPFEHHNFDQYPLIAPQPWELAKSSISTNRKSTTRFPTSHRWTVYSTLPLSPHRVARDFQFLPVNSKFCQKKSATKFHCMKTSSGIVVATSFLYLKIHRQIAGNVHIYLKFALKLTHPFRKRRLWQISINRAAATRDSEKVQLSLIRGRQRAFHRAIDEPCTLPLSPQRVVQNEYFYIWRCLLFLRCR